MKKRPFNMIIAGIGGQGVNTLTRVFIRLCERNHIQVQGSIHKGGAQQLGSVHSILRLFVQADTNYKNYSTQILAGDLDLILGLEPWETLRYARYFSPETRVIGNSRIVSIETERYQKRDFLDPNKQLAELDVALCLEDFSSAAERCFGTKKMLNFMLAQRSLLDKLMPFTIEEFSEVFLEQVKNIPPELQEKIRTP